MGEVDHARKEYDTGNRERGDRRRGGIHCVVFVDQPIRCAPRALTTKITRLRLPSILISSLATFAALIVAFARNDASSDIPRDDLSRQTISRQAISGHPASSRSSVSPVPTQVIGQAYFNLHAVKSLANLLELTPDVVVGTVESAEIWGNRDIPGVPRPAIEEQTPASDWPPPGHPKHGRQGPVEWPDDGRPNITVYQFRISEVLANGSSDRLNAGDVIPLFQSGGVKDGVAYVIEGIELLQVGETYVLFIQRQGTMEWYSAAPYGQYRLDGQTLIGPEYWVNAGVVKELAGRSVDEVRAMVRAASAD